MTAWKPEKITMNYQRILRAIGARPWAMQPERLAELIELIEMRMLDPAESAITSLYQTRAQLQAARAQAAFAASGSVALLPMFGSITHRGSIFSDFMGMMGGCALDRFTATFRQAVSDPNCRAIVIDVDSPGGQIDGVPELADEIFRSRGSKPIIAVADSLMASAAYWAASAADEVVASPSSMVGSIGVFTAHVDLSKALENAGLGVTLVSAGKYKTEGNPYQPLDDGSRQSLQSMVDDAYGAFTKAVAKHRGVKVSDVRSGYGEGRVLPATQAVGAGLADRVATLDQVLGKFGVARGNGNMTRVGSSTSLGTHYHRFGGIVANKKAAAEECECACDACQAGECSDCTMDPCTDDNCACDNQKATNACCAVGAVTDGHYHQQNCSHVVAKSRQDTKRVGGKDCTKACFAYRPDDDHANWKLPIESPDHDEEWEKAHIRNALARFDQTDMPNAEEKTKARSRVDAAAKKYGIGEPAEKKSSTYNQRAISDLRRRLEVIGA